MFVLEILLCWKIFQLFDSSPSSVCLTTFSFNQNKIRACGKKNGKWSETRQGREDRGKNYMVVKWSEFYWNITWNMISRKLLWRHEVWGKQKLRLWAGFGEEQVQTLLAAAAAPLGPRAGTKQQLSSSCHCPRAQWRCWGCCSDGGTCSGGWQRRGHELWEMEARAPGQVRPQDICW